MCVIPLVLSDHKLVQQFQDHKTHGERQHCSCHEGCGKGNIMCAGKIE